MKVVCPKCRNDAILDIKFSDAYRAGVVPSVWTFVCAKCSSTKRGDFKLYERIMYYFISFLGIFISIYFATISLNFFRSGIAIIFIVILTIFISIFIFWLVCRLYLKHTVLRKTKFNQGVGE